MPLNKVLLAVDDSDYARKATELLCEMAADNKHLHVDVLYVMEPIPPLISGPTRDQLYKDLEAAARTILAPHKDLLDKAGIANTTRISQGNPGTQILELARGEKFDMIAMGSRGRSSVTEILLGSVSQKVLQYYHGPVLIAR